MEKKTLPVWSLGIPVTTLSPIIAVVENIEWSYWLMYIVLVWSCLGIVELTDFIIKRMKKKKHHI